MFLQMRHARSRSGRRYASMSAKVRGLAMRMTTLGHYVGPECCQRDPESTRRQVTLTTFRKYFLASPQVAALRVPMLWRM